jgi:hypothetical protein
LRVSNLSSKVVITGNPTTSGSGITYFAVVKTSSSVTFTINFADCECPPWQIGPTLVDTWTPDSSCNLDFQSLPYTLPIFRLYMLARLGFSYKNDPTLANTWISDSDTCNVPPLLYTIPIFRLYKYINLGVNYKTEQTLTNQWGRNGCQ